MRRAHRETRAGAGPRLAEPGDQGRGEARVRVVVWNIRAGGGVRAAGIARQLARWQPDVVALSEFRATPPSARLAARLVAGGPTPPTPPPSPPLISAHSSANPVCPLLHCLRTTTRPPQ